MEKMLKPRSIAVIGASDKKGKIGNILIKNLKDKDYTGKIYPVNLRHKIIEDLKVYSSVTEIKNKVDLVIIAIPATPALLALEECAEKGVENVIVISAGFSESGVEGKKREKELKRVAQENGINILGPNCLGFINTDKHINASFAKKEVSVGDVGIISQSGAFVTGLLDIAGESEIGFSKVVTLGNKTMLDEIDFLEYLANDPKTKIIGLYLENIERGRDFYNLIAKITPKKPVLILKAGSSEKVQKAILSHTGSMAGETAIIKKSFQDSGALYFNDLASFWNTLKIFCDHKRPLDENIAILTNAGGLGVVTADLIEQSKLDFYNFSKTQKTSLRRSLPPAASVENPIDILGDADSERYTDSLEALSKIKDLGAVLVLITPQAQTDTDNILKSIKTAETKSKFPVIPIFIGKDHPNLFKFPGEGVSSLSRAVVFEKNKLKTRVQKKSPEKMNVLSSAKVRGFAVRAREDNRNIFFYSESLELMRYYGVNSLKAVEVDEDFKVSSIPGRLVMKVDDPGLLHKAAKGGVKTNIRSKSDFKKNFKQLRRTFKEEKIIIQKQAEQGAEIIIGLKNDPSFGPVLLCGVGGILTEIIDEKLLWILPVTKKEIRRDIKTSKIGEIFKKEGLDLESLVNEVAKIGKIGWQNNWIKELDVNPMFFYSDGGRPLAVDIKVKF